MMKEHEKRLQAHAELQNPNLILAEVNNLIAAAEERIEQQRKHLASVSPELEASKSARIKLERMVAALDKLKMFKARIGA